MCRKASIVSSHNKGDAVPEWLLVLEPSREDSNPGEFLFAVACHIIETSAGYFIVPDEECTHVLAIKDARHIDISAAGKDVFVPSSFTRIYVEKGRGQNSQLA